MAIRERLVYAIDVVTDQAQKGLQGFRQSVGQAEGATGKFKAGASSAMASVGANASMLAVAGGAALVAFGAKAISAFTDSAKAALDMGNATGLATEDASRWIAVADDFEVSAEQLTTGLGRISKTLDDTKWAEYGIATRDAAGNARDTNDILLDTFDMLGRIENETERARVGNELFGRGYANLAPLIGKTREEYEGMLGAVSKAQVITDKEAEKAEKMRLAQDRLNDALQDFTVLVGQELAPAASQAAEDLARITEGITEIKGAIDKVPGMGKVLEVGLRSPITGVVDSFNEMVDAAFEVNDALESSADSTAKTKTQVDRYIESLEGLDEQRERASDAAVEQTRVEHVLSQQAENYVDLLESRALSALEDLAETEAKAAAAADRHREAVDAVAAAMDAQTAAANSLVGGDIAVRQAQLDASDAAEELNAVLEAGGELNRDVERAVLDATDAQLQAAQAAADYRAQQMEANGEAVNAATQNQLLREELQKVADKLTGPLKDAILAYIAQLEAIPTNIDVNVNTHFNTRGDNPALRFGAHASGGTTTTPTFLAGEHGPELVSAPLGSHVSTAGETMGMLNAASASMSPGGVGGLAVIVHPGGIVIQGPATPETVMQGLAKFVRTNGNGALRKLVGD